MRVLCLFLSLLFCSGYLFGQASKDGFIIVNNGQYKYGNIQIDNSDSQYTQCFFKESSKSEFKKYSSADIEGYGIINESKFISREIKVDSESRKLFLKSEFQGLVKLYSYHSRLFVEETSLVELRQGEFINSLTDLLKSCRNIGSEIKRTSFNVKSITSLLERYEQCSKSNFVLPKKVNIHFEGLAGIELNSTQLTSNVEPFYFANVEQLKDRTLLSIGVRTQISLSRIRALSFCTGLYFYQQQFYLLSTVGINPVHTDKLNLDFNEFVVPLNLQYSATDETKSVRPYIRAGISIPFITNPSLRLEHSEESNNVIYFEQYDVMESFKQKIQLDVAGGLNFTISKKIRSFVELHYNVGNGEIMTTLSSSQTIASKSSRLNIMVGLRF